ncbi:MAG: methyltransferase domain-containing protein [Acidimicrobiales bacterium]
MTACLVCMGGAVECVLDLGSTTLANKFLTGAELGQPEPSFPLRAGFCPDCSHVQLIDRVPPAAMFEDYLYVSSASETLRGHFDDLAAELVARHRLGAGDLVIDIGSNDASLLASFARLGPRTLGVDPARNLAGFAAERGIERYTGFFDAATALELRETWGPAALITATNTLPHIPELGGFVQGLGTCLAPGGAFVAEAHYLADLVAQRAFDTVYHEHVSYWALGPARRLFADHGFEVVRAERLALHHGQLRLTAMRAGEGTIDASVEALAAYEADEGLGSIATYKALATDVAAMKVGLRRLLGELAADGARVAAYGAPAKGNTLLSYLGLGPTDIRWIAERSPLKQGRYTPGTHIPVVGPERLLEEMPDYVLLLAWNFADEILAQQKPYRDAGGRFIVPVPEPIIV